MTLRSVMLALALAASAEALGGPARAAPAAVAGADDAALNALFAEEWAWRQKEFARREEDDDWSMSAGYLPRVDAAAQARRAAYWRDVLARVEATPAERLSPEARTNRDVFRVVLTGFLEDQAFRAYEAPVNSDTAFWSDLDARERLADATAYERYLGRMRDTPRYFDEQMANMRAGLKRGFTPPQVTLAGRDASVAAYVVDDPEASPFYAAFRSLPETIPAAEQARLRQAARRTIAEQVTPAYRRLHAFLKTEYLPGARRTLAAEQLPDGAAFYRAQIRRYATLDLPPEEIHAIGLKEVARLEGEMQAAMRRTGFQGELPAFLDTLRSDPRFHAQSPEALLHRAAWISKRIDGEVGKVIGTLPRHRFTIRPVPAAVAPFYTSGRGGLDSCYFNTYDLPSRPLYNLPALVLHECIPGHSFQAAAALEQTARPSFRRRVYFSGYSEGWGLYSEWLGVGMGLYEDPYDDVGRLGYEMWRACRLVVDTGVHHYGWSREQAIAYLAAHTALSRHEIETEVDRYISWPGQAVSYKLGELTLRRLRADAERRLGPSFDAKRFHDVVLGQGSVPLPVLEAAVESYVREAAPAAP